MNTSGQSSQESGNPNRLNILVLDGGGVRGLSSLLILEALLGKVRQYARLEESHILKPHEVFQLVVGTSTGGLSALMISKLGMSAQDSIEEYEIVSEMIFKDGRHRRGKMSKGFLLPRYCGKHFSRTIHNLFEKKGANSNLPMSSLNTITNEFTHCAVVCKDHDAAQQNDHRPIFICSLECTEHFGCSVCQAARATAAAPFYFSPQTIGTEHEARQLIDGGFGANNPSYFVYNHFFKRDEASQNPHPTLTWDSLNFVNIGTGTAPDIKSKRIRVKKKIQTYLPRSLQQAIETLVTIKKLTVDSENASSAMQALALSDSAIPLRYNRFSADTGVHEIKLDKYKKLDDIREKTRTYIRDTLENNVDFDHCAQDLARDYLARRNPSVT